MEGRGGGAGIEGGLEGRGGGAGIVLCVNVNCGALSVNEYIARSALHGYEKWELSLFVQVTTAE